MLKVKLPFDNITILQDKKNHPITSDTQLLTDTVLVHHADAPHLRVLELGTGNGVIAIMLALHHPDWFITAVDIQIPLIRLAKANLELAGVNVFFLLADIRNISQYLNNETFDIVLSNPPYFPFGKGKISPNQTKFLAKNDILCSVSDVMKAMDATLSNGGNGYLIYPAEREKQLQEEAEKFNLAVELLNSHQKERNLYLITRN